MRTTGIVDAWRCATLFMRSVSWVVVMALILVLLRPGLVEAQQLKPPQPRAAIPTAEPDEVLAAALVEAGEVLAEVDRELAAARPARAGLKRIAALRERIADVDREVQKGFGEVAALIAERGLPDEIRQRHEEAQAVYRARLAGLLAELDAIAAAGSPEARRRTVRAALAELTSRPLERPHQPLDPDLLPVRRPDPETRPPALTPAEWRAVLAGDLSGKETAVVAAPAAVAAPAVPPQPPDLDPTEEVQITPEIQALASDLDNSPLAIYRWVHDHVEFVPTYGSIQGSQTTLLARRGNAFDTAALLIALLRAAGVPARFVVGTVEVPVAKLQNWLGGAASPAVAQQLLGQGGIPNVGLLQSGLITHVRMEHVWVEAWVNYLPGRGARPGPGGTWVPLDAAFKQYLLTPGVGALTAVPFDLQGMSDYLLDGAEVDPVLGRIANIDPNRAIEKWFDFQQDLGEFVEDGGFPATQDALLGSRTIVASDLTMLPNSLPNEVVVRGAATANLPASLRLYVQLKGYASQFDRVLGTTAFSYRLSLPELNTRRLGLYYEPATPADADAIAAAIAAGASSLPLHLIHVVPVVSLDDAGVASGPSVGMGTTQYLDVILEQPGPDATVDYQVTAGDLSIISIDANGITQEMVQARFDRMGGDTADETLHQVALHYWAETDYFGELAAAGLQVHALRRPSVGLFASPLTVSYLFGVPRSGFYQDRFMDVKRSLVGVAAADPARARAFVQISGQQGSFLEGSVFDQLSGRPLGRGISAMQLLFDAALAGVPIYNVTAANSAAVLPLLAVPTAIKNDIANAVNAGKTVLVPEREIVKDIFRGVGYIVEDPVTGAAAYLISGGLNGGRLFECLRDLVPVLVLIAVIIAIIVLIWWLWPWIAGALAGAGALVPKLAAIAAAFAAIFLSSAPAYAAGGAGGSDPCRCPPCPPPPPCRVDLVPPSRKHFPCPGDHWHYQVYNQVPWPDCRCFLSGSLFGGCIPPPLPVPCPPI